jgi:hypothetical protein
MYIIYSIYAMKNKPEIGTPYFSKFLKEKIEIKEKMIKKINFFVFLQLWFTLEHSYCLFT